MTSSGFDAHEAVALNVIASSESIAVDLADGRTLVVPLSWYPRLAQGTQAERDQWRLTGGGAGIHWPALDEDISIEDLMAGRRSMETPASLKRWREAR